MLELYLLFLATVIIREIKTSNKNQIELKDKKTSQNNLSNIKDDAHTDELEIVN